MTQRLNIQIGVQRLDADISFSPQIAPTGIFDFTFDLTFG